VHGLTGRGIGLKVLTGHRATINATTAAGKLVFGIFAALAEFERELIAERTAADLASARARGRNGGRPYKKIATGNGINGAARDESQYVMPGAGDNPTNAVPPHIPGWSTAR